MVYESFSTEDDVVLFTKVLDNRQGINRPPTEFRCMFGDTNDKSNAVRTAVMSSVQEVFRCHHPNVTAVNSNIKFSLEIFLREWVIYHSKIGVDRFIFYDNDSDDGLENVVK
ncbi:hypothetical protein ACFX1S_023339 [Malus domestica]